jgi:hypothetical protein
MAAPCAPALTNEAVADASSVATSTVESAHMMNPCAVSLKNTS